jgi:hypothetical protein
VTEAELKRIVVRVAQNYGWTVHETPQIKPRRPVRSDAGYPDLTIARDRSGERRVMWLELKQDKGELTAEQMHWKSLLESYVIRPSDVVSGYLMELLK